MKIETQTNPELIQLCKLIKDMKVAMLTNIDEYGALTSRPMTPLEMDAKGYFWFFIDSRSAPKGEQLGSVNLSFSDEAGSTYVSMSGHSEISQDRVMMARLWTSFAKPWFPEGPDSPDLALLKFVPASAEYWDSPHSSMVRMFAMVASIAAGKPIGMGEHDTLNTWKSDTQKTLGL